MLVRQRTQMVNALRGSPRRVRHRRGARDAEGRRADRGRARRRGRPACPGWRARHCSSWSGRSRRWRSAIAPARRHGMVRHARERRDGAAAGDHPRHRRDHRDSAAGAGARSARLRSARHFAAWLGLTPTPHSSGGKERLGTHLQAGQPDAALAPGARRHGAATLCEARTGGADWASAPAGAAAIQGRRRGAGQQDGPHRLGAAGPGRNLQHAAAAA